MADTSYTDVLADDLGQNTHNYCVTSVYAQGESIKICKDVSVPALGINSQGPFLQISVYPNPADNVLHIRSAAAINNLQLTDLSGREVLYYQPGNETVNLPVTSFKPGIYLLTLQTIQGTFHLKVLVR